MFTVWTSNQGFETKTPNYETVIKTLKENIYLTQADETKITRAQYSGEVVNIQYGFAEAQVRYEG